MPREIFQRPRRSTPEERGHKPTCEYIDARGLSCNCDGLLSISAEAALGRLLVSKAMELGGWTLEAETGAWTFFQRRIGEHRITISRAISGWAIVWMRGVGWTILEERGYGTAQMAMTVFWEHVIARSDQADENHAKLAQLTLAATE